jgi:sugar lactone lactonase YvrE
MKHSMFAVVALGAAMGVGLLTGGTGVAPASAEPSPTLLVSGLQGSFGSTIGPGGDLYVAEGAARRISRIDPETGTRTTFASGFPAQVVPGAGAATDIEFIGGTAYVLVQFIGSYLGGPDEVNGIYRVDGPHTFTVVADIGAFNVAHPPDTDFQLPTGVQTSFQAFRGGFLVTDGHLNRMLRVTLDGDISVLRAFDNIVPVGLETWGNTIYMAEAGPLPHLPADGKIVSFTSNSSAVTEIAAGGPLMVDVERGRGTALYGLAQGTWPPGTFAGHPAEPNTGKLLRVDGDGTFRTVVDGLNQPSSFDIIKDTAYVVTLGGEIWKIDDIS